MAFPIQVVKARHYRRENSAFCVLASGPMELGGCHLGDQKLAFPWARLLFENAPHECRWMQMQIATDMLVLRASISLTSKSEMGPIACL